MIQSDSHHSSGLDCTYSGVIKDEESDEKEDKGLVEGLHLKIIEIEKPVNQIGSKKKNSRESSLFIW